MADKLADRVEQFRVRTTSGRAARGSTSRKATCGPHPGTVVHSRSRLPTRALIQAIELQHSRQCRHLMPGGDIEQTDNLTLVIARHRYAGLQPRQQGLRIR